jgi:hypothetical protein
MSEPDQLENNTDFILKLARPVVSARTIKEFTPVISEAYLSLDRQGWNHLVAEGWRLRGEGEQKENTVSAAHN